MNLEIIRYLKNRFSIFAFLPVILMFYLTIYLYLDSFEESIKISLKNFLGFCIILLVFFNIRVLDDLKDKIKDFDFKNLKTYLSISIILQIIIILIIDYKLLLIYLIVLIYSILIYYDFLVNKLFSKHIILRNFIHQILIILIGLFVYYLIFEKIIFQNILIIIFLVDMYLIFALFEFTRKIKKKESKDFDASYLSILGKNKFCASVLSITMLIIVFTTYLILDSNLILLVTFGLISTITILSILYYITNKSKEKILKISLFLFMLITLLTIIIYSILKTNVVFNIQNLVIT